MITISTGTIVRTLLFLVLLYVLVQLSGLVLIVLTSVVLASAVEPAARRLMKHRIPRVPAVLTVYLGVLMLVAGLFYLVVPFVVKESVGIIDVLPGYVETIQHTGNLSAGDTNNLTQQISQAVPLKQLIDTVTAGIKSLSGGFWDLVGKIFGGVFSFILIIVISFYLAIEERGIESFLKVITPVEYHEYMVDLWRRSQHKIGRWMQGQIVLGLIVGIMVYLLLSLIGVRYAFTLAAFAAVLEIIPIFGPIISAVPGVLLGFAQGGPGLALLLVGAYVLIQQFESHLIYPLVVKKVVGVPPVLVIIALLAGGEIAGFLGVILAVPLAAAMMEFVTDIQKRKKLT
ncbi:MAG: AI-2E family transporter [Minisyncoccota bacterium]